MGCTDDYTYNYNVTSFDADQNRELTISALLRIQQEAGEQHLRTGGLGYSVTYEQGVIFVITRAAAVVHRLPRFGEGAVRCKTWSNGFSGMLFTRSYALESSDGEPLVEAVSMFTPVDPETFRLIRPDRIKNMDINHFPERLGACPPPEKLRLANEPLVHTANKEITYSMIDYNGHLNNTKYADIVYDAYPGKLQNSSIKSFNINFLGQALCGDVIDVQCAAKPDGHYLFKGSHERGNCFAAELCTVPRT